MGNDYVEPQKTMSAEEEMEYAAWRRAKRLAEQQGLPAVPYRGESFPGAPAEYMPRRRRQPWEGVDIHVDVCSTATACHLDSVSRLQRQALRSSHCGCGHLDELRVHMAEAMKPTHHHKTHSHNTTPPKVSTANHAFHALHGKKKKGGKR